MEPKIKLFISQHTSRAASATSAAAAAAKQQQNCGQEAAKKYEEINCEKSHGMAIASLRLLGCWATEMYVVSIFTGPNLPLAYV